MHPVRYFIFLLLGLLSCKDQSSPVKQADTAAIKTGVQSPSPAPADEGPKRPFYLVNNRLDLPSYSIFCLSKLMLPLGKLQHDSNYYFNGRYCIAVHDKFSKADDTVEMESEDPEYCSACPMDVLNLTDSLGIRPLFLQVVMGGLDLTTNAFIGFRKGKLKELFRLDDTETRVILKRTDSTTLRGFIFGVDEIVHAVQHNYPVSIDINTYTVSKPLPDTQYIGFRTVALEGFRAYRVVNGQIDTLLLNVKKGDSLTIDTFYRARHKIQLLTEGRDRIEIKLETGQKKLWSPGAPG